MRKRPSSSNRSFQASASSANAELVEETPGSALGEAALEGTAQQCTTGAKKQPKSAALRKREERQRKADARALEEAKQQERIRSYKAKWRQNNAEKVKDSRDNWRKRKAETSAAQKE